MTEHDHVADDDLIARAVRLREEEMALARERGEHYWLAMTGYKVTPPIVGNEIILDLENLRTGLEVACMLCLSVDPEKDWEGKCLGEPQGSA